MAKHIKINVYGFVQGVSFRKFVQEKAQELQVDGCAKNMPGGAVLIEAEGREEDLEDLLGWCRRGPEMAMVERVDFEYSDQLKNYQGFKIG